MHQALNNWGSLLVDFGKSKIDAEAESLFQQAEERYDQATVMKPDFYEAWSNWGNLLLDWRKRKQGAQAAALFEQAQQKYQKAKTLRPDMPEPLDNWGNSSSTTRRRCRAKLPTTGSTLRSRSTRRLLRYDPRYTMC